MAPTATTTEKVSEEILNESSVKVVCRVRPHIEDVSSCAADALSVVGNTVEVVSDNKGNVSSFQFDRVLDTATTQQEVYESAAWNLVEGVLDGYDGALFCYGQTGGGKTYTLEGSLDASQYAGILPRAAHHIFEAAEELNNVHVTVSCVEIYLERIQDLLVEGRSPCAVSQNLGIRELDGRGPRVLGCREIEVTSPKELLRLARRGASRRHVAATRMNDRSSRSHSIFSITVSHTDRDDEHIFSGTVHLVDLAGSERQLQSRSEGRRLDEARNINRSLSTLGTVIVALASANDGHGVPLSHVPYRNSKLTWLLREALGGSAQAVLVLAVSPSMADRRETLSSLRFGSRAMCVDNQPVARILPRTHLQGGIPEEAILELPDSKLGDEVLLGHSASTSSTATASTESLGACSAASPGTEQELMAEAFEQAFRSLGGAHVDPRKISERFLAMREQISRRNEVLARAPPFFRQWSQPPLFQKPRKWHAAVAWDFSAGGEPKLRAQLFEACDVEDAGDHRLMMEMSAEEFAALPISPLGRW